MCLGAEKMKKSERDIESLLRCDNSVLMQRWLSFLCLRRIDGIDVKQIEGRAEVCEI